MTVHEFLGMAVNSANYFVKIFDCTRWDAVFNEGDCLLDKPVLPVLDEVDFQGFGDYEVTSYEIYPKDGNVFLELNICMDEEDEDY